MYRFIKSNKYLNRQWLFLSILVVAVIMLRLPALSQPFDNDSGANAYHARLILRGEPLYSTHHPAHHLPGVYYTYTVAFLLLGDSTWSIKVLLIPWTILTAYIIYLYGKQLDRELTGYLASFFFILLTSHVFLKGHTAETELFANLPITAAIFLAVYLTINNAKNWLFTFVGVICAVAFLYKAVFLSPIIIVGIILIVDALLTKEKVDSWQISARRIFWTACGFVVPILIVLILFARIELLSRLLLVFTLGQGYTVDQASRVGIFQVIYLPFYVLAINNLAILILSIAGIVNLARRIRKKIYSDNPFIITAIALILPGCQVIEISIFSKT